jgi:hypothetical protein
VEESPKKEVKPVVSGVGKEDVLGSAKKEEDKE